MAVLQVGATGSFLLFVVIPGVALAAAIAFSGYEVYHIGERKLLIVLVILALMFQHQLLEAVSFVQTGDRVGEGIGEIFETGANLVASGSVYYVLRFARRERRLVDDLERHRRRFQLIAEHIDEIIYLATEDFSEILYINPAYEDIYGRSAESLYESPRSFVEAAHPDDRARYEEDIERMIADIESGNPADSYDGEYRLWVDDEVRWIRAARFPVENDDGSVDRIVGQVRDITERKQREREYEQIFNGVKDGINIMDPETLEIVDANEAYLDLLGYDDVESIRREGVEGLSLTEEGFTPETGRAIHQRVADSGEPEVVEWRAETADGRRLWLEVKVTPAVINGDRLNIVIHRDITERRRREQRLEVFNRILRHNLRNQLDVVKSHAEALADRTDGGHPERIIASADRLAGMGERARQIDRCLSREIQPTRIDVTTALHRSLERVTDSQGVAVTTELPSDASIVTDEEVLHAILDGVLENAVTYADSSVTVTVEPGPDEHTVVVADDGPGIPEDQLASIEAGGETDLRHGRGLGLWQIKWGVEKLDGTLSFETDGGTTVRITLPNHDRIAAT